VDKFDAAAKHVFDEQRALKKMVRMPPDLHPKTLDEAYEVQKRLVELYRKAGMGEVVGWKLGLTAKVQQEKFGVPHPFEGAMVASRIKQSPFAAKSGDYGQIGVESEIVLRLGRPLPASGAPYTRETVADAVDAAMAGIEIADLRNVDLATLDVTMLVSDNAMNNGCIIGPAVTDWRRLDLGALKCRMVVNGKVVGEGHGRDAYGHPLEALAWLANRLAKRGGRGLEKGDLVMTGSLVVNKVLQKGDTMATEIEGLGEAKLTVG
jgi:2-keto-4-pentenoate hydratase